MATTLTLGRPKGAKDKKKRKRKKRSTLLKTALIGAGLVGAASAGAAAYLNRDLIKELRYIDPSVRKDYIKELKRAFAISAMAGAAGGGTQMYNSINARDRLANSSPDTRRNRLLAGVPEGAITGGIAGGLNLALGYTGTGGIQMSPRPLKTMAGHVIGGAVAAPVLYGVAQRLGGDRSERKRRFGFGYERRTGLLN
jgi:hypothetical protein